MAEPPKAGQAPPPPRPRPAEPKMAEPEAEPDPVHREAAAPAEPADASTMAEPPAASRSTEPVEGVLDATALRRIWPEVLEAVKRSSRRTRALLDGAQVHDLDGDLVTLSIAAAPLARMLGEDSNTEVIKSALTQTVGGAWRLTVIVFGGPSAAAESPPPAPEPAPPPPPKIDVPPPPVPRPAHERASSESNAKPAGPETDPREDSEPEAENEDGVRIDPEAEALRLLESTLGARPITD
jgi:DNA polymerase III subunit gamma/tau